MAATPDELPLGRLEAFSDGVFAIAITLLVLELGIPADAGEHLLESILHQWPQYLAYVTSFLTIGIIWLQHSMITATLRTADVTLYRLNFLVLLALDLAMTAFLRYAVEHRRLVADHVDEETANAALARQPSYAFYAIAIAIGYLFPTIGVALYLAISLSLGLPLRTVHRLLRRL